MSVREFSTLLFPFVVFTTTQNADIIFILIFTLGNINMLAIIFGALCILVAVTLSISMGRFSKKGGRYSLQEEKRSGKLFIYFYFLEGKMSRKRLLYNDHSQFIS